MSKSNNGKDILIIGAILVFLFWGGIKGFLGCGRSSGLPDRTEDEIHLKNIDASIGVIAGIQPGSYDSRIEGIIKAKALACNISESEMYAAVDSVYSALSSTMAGGNGKQLLNDYLDILFRMIQKNKSDLSNDVKRVVDIAELEKKYPFWTRLGYQPSKLAIKKMSGASIDNDLNSMLKLYYASSGSDGYELASRDIDAFNRILQYL